MVYRFLIYHHTTLMDVQKNLNQLVVKNKLYYVNHVKMEFQKKITVKKYQTQMVVQKDFFKFVVGQ